MVSQSFNPIHNIRRIQSGAFAKDRAVWFQPQGGCVTKPRVGPLFPDTLEQTLYPNTRRPKRGTCHWTRKSGPTLGKTFPGINPYPNGVAACVRHVCAICFQCHHRRIVIRRGPRHDATPLGLGRIMGPVFPGYPALSRFKASCASGYPASRHIGSV